MTLFFESEHTKQNQGTSFVHISDDDHQQGEQGNSATKRAGGVPSHRNVDDTPFCSSSHTTTNEHTIGELGSKVRIQHDEARVYAAMKNGTATLVQCVGCSRHLLATRDVELVYCPGCGTITPIEIGECLPDSPPSSCCESVARRQQQG